MAAVLIYITTASTVEAITTLVSEGRSGNAKRTSRATVR